MPWRNQVSTPSTWPTWIGLPAPKSPAGLKGKLSDTMEYRLSVYSLDVYFVHIIYIYVFPDPTGEKG